MDPVSLARHAALGPTAHYRQPDDHAASQPAVALPIDTPIDDAADVARLAGWLGGAEGAIDPERLPSSGPREYPLTMPVQPLTPSWFGSMLEIMGLTDWRGAPECALLRSDG